MARDRLGPRRAGVEVLGDALLEGIRKAVKAMDKIRENKKRKDGLLSLDYDW